MPLDVPVHTCALGYLWTLLLCKPCFYGQPVASVSSTGRRTFSISEMFRQPAGHDIVSALCLEMLLLMPRPERCVSTSLYTCQPIFFSTVSPLLQK